MDHFAKYLLTALICIVALGQFVQVITRYVLQVPVMGLEETMLYPTLWLYILGSVNASRENTHKGREFLMKRSFRCAPDGCQVMNIPHD